MKRLGLAMTAFAGVALASDPPKTVHSTLLLQGVDAVWAHRPHRLKVLGAGLDVFGVAPGDKPQGEAWLEMEGGTWADGTKRSDVPDVHLSYAGLSTTDRPILRGSETLIATGHSPRDPRDRQPGVASRTILVSRPAGAPDGAAVWLTGFRVATSADHPEGFTMHTLEVQIGAPTIEDGQYRFDLSTVVEAAPVPDRAQDLATYSATIQIDWALVPADPGMVSRQDVGGQLKGGVASAGDAERIQPESIPFSWAATKDNEVLAALSGF